MNRPPYRENFAAGAFLPTPPRPAPGLDFALPLLQRALKELRVPLLHTDQNDLRIYTLLGASVH